jgi:hypothetical protein
MTDQCSKSGCTIFANLDPNTALSSNLNTTRIAPWLAWLDRRETRATARWSTQAVLQIAILGFAVGETGESSHISFVISG